MAAWPASPDTSGQAPAKCGEDRTTGRIVGNPDDLAAMNGPAAIRLRRIQASRFGRRRAESREQSRQDGAGMYTRHRNRNSVGTLTARSRWRSRGSHRRRWRIKRPMGESSVPEWGVSSGFTRTGAAKDAKRIPRFIPEDDKLCKKEMSCRARMHLGRVGGAKHLRRSRWEHGRVARDGAWPIMMVGHRQAPHESM